jgi:uncharacterized delta-60 repeat protein
MKLRLLSLVALLCALTFAVRAQDTWTARTSGVTVPLWSVAYAVNQWVAVGEQGTILTSPDGAAWTPRTSGFPTRWLVGVGYGTPGGTGLWVVVGESGLILTSPDAITWTARRAAGTRINAVAWGNGTFVAADDAGSTYYSLDGITWSGPYPGARSTFARGLVYGAPHFVTTGLSGINTTYDGITSLSRLATAPQLQAAAYGRRLYLATGGANTFTSRDALTWTQQPASTNVGVQGATFFNNQFLAVGNAGGITTSFDGSAWTDRVSGTTQNLIAVAASPDTAVAVGFAGTILQSAATPAAPVPTLSVSAVTEAVGGNVALTVTTRGSAPFTYQWRKDGTDLPDATTDTLFLTNVQLTQSGAYTCLVTNPVATTATSPATLNVVSSFPPVDPVDLTFTLGATLNAPPRSGVLQPDGKIIIGGSFLLLNEGQAQFGLARLTANGALDTTFKPGAIDPNGVVQTIVVQPDGKILIGGNFASINGIARNRIARLNADGSLDLAFIPAYTPTTAVTQLALTSEGRILVVNASTALTRLNPDGSNDATWQFTPPSTGINGTTNIQMVALQSDGKVLVGAVVFASNVNTGYLRRLNADGTADSTFPGSTVSSGLTFTFRAIRALADGSIMAAGSTTLNGGNGFAIQRVLNDGTPDPEFVTQVTVNTSISSVAFTDDGRTWLSGPFSFINSTAFAQLARLSPNGTVDLTYSPGTGPLSSSGSTANALFILPLDDGRAIAGGDFATVNATARPYLARLNAQSIVGNRPAFLTSDSPYREVRAGESFRLPVSVTGSPQILYTTITASGTISSSYSNIISVPAPGLTSSGSVVSVGAGNGYGRTFQSQTFYIRSIPSAPFLIAQPVSMQTNTGRPVTLSVTSGGSSGLSYQWFKNGTAIPNATTSSYTYSNPQPTDSGDYTVVIRNSLGFATSDTVHLGVDETPRFINIATRALAGRPDAPLIAGFVVAGPGSKRVMLRASGPSLAALPFNLTGTLADPVLSVYNSAGTLIYTNDDWGSANDVPGIASAGTRLGAFTLQGNSADAAGILNLSPGSYTAVVTGKAGATGIALVEVYEDDNLSSRLINLSTRAYVGTDSSVAIPGIVVRGAGAPKKLLIRAVGPGLTPFGVSAVLADPTIKITDSTGATIATNDDWETAANLADLNAATARVTFPLAPGSKDSAVLVSVPPGGYTVQVGGVANTTGNVLVEVYEIP